MNRWVLSAVFPAVAVIWGGALADPTPFPDFSAKMVKPPAKGTKKRITVQITADPEPVATVSRTDAPKHFAGAGTDTYGWFWADISPELSAKGAARLEPALVRLMNPPQGKGVTAPRLQLLQTIAARYGADILRSTVGTRVSPALVLAVIAVESAGSPKAESAAGAQGLMQLMPDTATRFGVGDRFSPEQNIKGGVAFLDQLMAAFDNDPVLVLAGYNAGENAVLQNGGVPDYPETRAYVPKVLEAYRTARGLCLTPPELLSDGCVFRVASR